MKTADYRVEVHQFRSQPRQVMVWRAGIAGWVFWGSMPIPADVDATALEAEVMKRLPAGVAHESTDRVSSMLKAS